MVMANGTGATKPIAGAAASPAKPVGKARTLKPSKTKVAVQKKFDATIFCSKTPLPEKFVAAVREVETIIKAPLWMVIQDANGGVSPPPYYTFDQHLLKSFMSARKSLPNKPVHLLLDSPGGEAKRAYQLANLFRIHCGGFVVYVPEYAKSAATLFVLGASQIYMATHAELGPLDVQIYDAEREEYCWECPNLR